MSTGDPTCTLIFSKWVLQTLKNKQMGYQNSKMHLNIEKYPSFQDIQEKNDNFSAEWPLEHP